MTKLDKGILAILLLYFLNPVALLALHFKGQRNSAEVSQVVAAKSASWAQKADRLPASEP